MHPSWFSGFSPFKLVYVGHMVARLAFVLAERPNFEACCIAAFGLQDSVGYRRRDRTAQLTQSFGERPHAILHTRQHVITACGDERTKVQDKLTCEDPKWTYFNLMSYTALLFSMCIGFFVGGWCQNHIWHFTQLTSQSLGLFDLGPVMVYLPTSWAGSRHWKVHFLP